MSSNVPRIVRAIKPFDGSVNQIVYYQRGVASADNSFQTKVVGGITGEAITGHIREAYGFLANNFNPQSQADLKDESKAIDEIVLLGFSRGAFTARAISSLISDVGLLTKRGMEEFWGIFEDVRLYSGEYSSVCQMLTWRCNSGKIRILMASTVNGSRPHSDRKLNLRMRDIGTN